MHAAVVRSFTHPPRGRSEARLTQLEAIGADRTVVLDDTARLGAVAANVDVVLDYLWGSAAAAAIPAILRQRQDRGRPLSWIEIGSMAGLELSVQSQWLRAARLQLVGSGQGSVPTREIVAELSELAAHITQGGYTIDARPVALSDVEDAWTRSPGAGERVVFVPA
jgi:hypothetical protein